MLTCGLVDVFHSAMIVACTQELVMDRACICMLSGDWRSLDGACSALGNARCHQRGAPCSHGTHCDAMAVSCNRHARRQHGTKKIFAFETTSARKHGMTFHDHSWTDTAADTVLRPAPRQRRRLMLPSGASGSSGTGPSQRVIELRRRHLHALPSEPVRDPNHVALAILDQDMAFT